MFSRLRFKRLAEEQGSEIDTGPMCCKWCFNTWLPGKYSVILKPQKYPKKHMRSLLKKDVNTLNKFQHKLVAKIKKTTTGNTLVSISNIVPNKSTNHLENMHSRKLVFLTTAMQNYVHVLFGKKWFTKQLCPFITNYIGF